MQNIEERKQILDGLKAFFTQCKMPEQVQLDKSSIITNTKKFIESHIALIENYIGAIICKPYILRLLLLKNIVENKKYSEIKPEIIMKIKSSQIEPLPDIFVRETKPRKKNNKIIEKKSKKSTLNQGHPTLL